MPETCSAIGTIGDEKGFVGGRELAYLRLSSWIERILVAVVHSEVGTQTGIEDPFDGHE